MRYLSIITNFGCSHRCPYCVTRNRHVLIDPENDLSNLKEAMREAKPDIISVSGGGDPLNDYDKHRDWWAKLMEIIGGIPLEIHTSYLKNDFDIPCERIVYHPVSKNEDISLIKRKGSEKIRVVYVVTDDFTIDDLADLRLEAYANNSIDEFSYRQLVRRDGIASDHLERELMIGHSQGWWHYIKQADYNIYFANGRLYNEFQRING